jgi:hypothetical protein
MTELNLSTCSPHERAPARRLSTREGRDWLTSHGEGRLAYQTGRGPRSVVVRYALADDHVVFRLPDYNDIVHYAPGERVTLEVEDGDRSTGDLQAVTVTGQAQLETDQTAPAAPETQFEEEWPSGVRTSVIRLPLVEIEGYRRDS